MSNPFDFTEDPPGTFEMNVNVTGGDNDSGWWASFPMHRNTAEELLFQMAFILGYKVG